MDARPEPTQRLPRRARTLWRLEAALRWGGAAVGALVLLSGLGDRAPGWVALLVAGVVATGAVLEIGVVPGLRWRRWRYEVREEEIDLRRGTFTVVRTLVPIARVQHVDTKQDVLEQALEVSTVVFHTAAGANRIPALRSREAGQVRDRIAALARTPDEL